MTKKQKPCVFEELNCKDWGWCKTHDVGYNPLTWHGKKKFCPYACQCKSCETLHDILKQIHHEDGRKGNAIILKEIKKLWQSWGLYVGNL